ncbi:MAG: tyrosine-type recombinase/integrase [Solirubrobacteraceae bacterium]
MGGARDRGHAPRGRSRLGASGRPCSRAGVRAALRNAVQADRGSPPFAPHQLRHPHAVEMSRAGVPLLVIQHPDLGITPASRAKSTTPKSSTPSTNDLHQ